MAGLIDVAMTEFNYGEIVAEPDRPGRVSPRASQYQSSVGSDPIVESVMSASGASTPKFALYGNFAPAAWTFTRK